MWKTILIGLICSLLFLNSQAQSIWSFEIHCGEVYNVPMPLTIRQDNYPPIKIQAKFESEPFTLPLYVDSRVIRWKNKKSWEAEFLHHKLYLQNTTPEVEKYNISHGFNMLMVNRGFDHEKFQFRFGAGIVLSHPESIIRGKEFGDSENNWDLGYYISGPAINLSLGKQMHLSKRIYINAEAKATLAYGRIKIADGNSDVYSLAFHLILGIGFDFIHPTEK
jgi:hypothetical protein